MPDWNLNTFIELNSSLVNHWFKYVFSYYKHLYTWKRSYTCKHRKLVKQRRSVLSLLEKSKCFSYCAGPGRQFSQVHTKLETKCCQSIVFLQAYQGEVKVLYRCYSSVVCERLQWNPCSTWEKSGSVSFLQSSVFSGILLLSQLLEDLHYYSMMSYF